MSLQLYEYAWSGPRYFLSLLRLQLLRVGWFAGLDCRRRLLLLGVLLLELDLLGVRVLEGRNDLRGGGVIVDELLP